MPPARGIRFPGQVEQRGALLAVGYAVEGKEVARLPEGAIAVRNSRFPSGPALVYTRAEIQAFLAGAKDGEFDHVLS